MAWSKSSRKWRNQIRARYCDDTGATDYSDPTFEDWLIRQGVLPMKPLGGQGGDAE